jgi:alcohol dehydrogenase
VKFVFHLPTKLVFGYGEVNRVGPEAAALGGSRVLVVTDKVMVKTGIAERVTSALNGKNVDVFDGVQAEPSIDVAQSVADAARSKPYDLVVGVGGGSSMDMAKVAAGFATNEGDALSFVGNDKFARRPLSSIMVPTTAGTGAELTVTSMVTVGGHKQWINSPLLLPSVAVVDPELSMSMPPGVTAATGMDALCHNTESYMSSLASPITDSAALEGVSMIVANLERAYLDGSDRGAREKMSVGALLGGIALQARMVYGHSVGYTIATKFNLPHGVSCGVPLPYIISNYAVALGPRMSGLARAFGVGDLQRDFLSLGMEVAEKARSIVASVGIGTNLKQVGVAEQDLEGLAAECLRLYSRPNSPMVFDAKSMAAFYERMWKGELSP